MHFENRNERVQSKAKQSKAVDLWWSQCWYPILFLFQPVTTVLLFILPSRAKLRRSCRQLRQLVEHLSFGLAVRLLWELVCVCVSVCVSVCLSSRLFVRSPLFQCRLSYSHFSSVSKSSNVRLLPKKSAGHIYLGQIPPHTPWLKSYWQLCQQESRSRSPDALKGLCVLASVLNTLTWGKSAKPFTSCLIFECANSR